MLPVTGTPTLRPLNSVDGDVVIVIDGVEGAGLMTSAKLFDVMPSIVSVRLLVVPAEVELSASRVSVPLPLLSMLTSPGTDTPVGRLVTEGEVYKP